MAEQYPFSNLPSVDEEAVKPLKDMLGDSYPALINDYLSSSPTKIQELKKAINDNDTNEVLHIAHTLKSSSGNFGFIRLFKRLEYLELQARKNHIDNPIAQYDLIDQEFNHILNQTDND